MSQRHGIKLLIEDYPYASDGLLIWEAIQNWVQTYVTRYYPDPSLVCNDRELHAWYAEVINVDHADLRYENWWPTLANAEDLTAILTTIIWLASAQHATLNFGQYPYRGYIPNRPPRMRRLIPDENDPEYTSFLEDPQNYFLLALPSMLQSTKYMAVVDTLSTHSPDEEYIGERQQRDTWSGDAEMVEAFYGFASEIQRIEKEIEKRNRDMSLKNRCGAGVLPYELLAPNCIYSAMAMTDIDTFESIAVGDSLLHDIKGALIESAFITCGIHSSALGLRGFGEVVDSSFVNDLASKYDVYPSHVLPLFTRSHNTGNLYSSLLHCLS
ncbi:linoleate 13S-lipoxygenase 3-1, chloroplastic-like protein [Tanacetum coccineum]